MAATYQLHIKDIFDGLNPREQLYAHHLARAAWQGTRIVLRQTSPESEDIFDFILGLHVACRGEWSSLVNEDGVSRADVDAFLDYAGQFLTHLGNYYGDGDRKVVPQVSADALRKMASISPATTAQLEKIIEPLIDESPFSLGFPGPGTQSAYYPGPETITKEEITAVAEIMERHSIAPENTRLRKTVEGAHVAVFNILQASAQRSSVITELPSHDHPLTVRISTGDHAAELSKVCAALQDAANYAPNETQSMVLHGYVDSFRTGSTEAYRRAQKTWVSDLSPRVETIFGFVEPYRDPYGVRAEWESIVCISDPDETQKLARLVGASTNVIGLLPWAVPGENNGKGPFEASLFQAPGLDIVHALACCGSVVWDGINLPNYSDIRETCGLKNILLWNRMAIRAESDPPSRHVHPSEAEPLKAHGGLINCITTALHELIGHGSGKLLTETASNIYNFDRDHLPTNPLTGNPVQSWYKLGQTWTSVFGKLATTVEECRATLISYYLADEKEVLHLFGLEDEEEIAEFIYYVYLTIAVKGIDALTNFNPEDQSWGDQHARGSFAILRHLLQDGNDVITVNHSPSTGTLQIHVDRSKILSHGKPSLGRLLLRLHVWRCTADINSCTEFYNPLTAVDGRFEAWREAAMAAWSSKGSSLVQSEPGGKIIQLNTFVTDYGRVELKVYDTTNEGIIESFLDRGI
ncbi:dipeptidyl peptidase III [Podospora conica]|nr:dipeptidyl peptidase III [Schizothecium conicum]